jgi:hypothetical protein
MSYFDMGIREKYRQFMKDYVEIKKIENLTDKRIKLDRLLQQLRVLFETNYKDSSLLSDIRFECHELYFRVEPSQQIATGKKNSNIQGRKESVIVKAILEIKERLSLSEEAPISSLGIIVNILKNFHEVVKQLAYRYEDRATITIQDEYDVQDLLGALLKINFADVRSEEWTPSSAGKSARMDKLLKVEKMVIEVKMTHEKHKDKEIGDEIKIDYATYKTHPDCKFLVVFIYDSQGLLKNPHGLKNDLEKISSKEFPMRVFINP